MTYKLFLSRALKGFSITLLTSALSLSAIIYDSGITALKNTDPTQLGRISRNGIPSDWSTPKAFPSIVNSTTFYRYETFVVPSSPFSYLQISFDDLTAANATFASAYLNSYNPSSTGTNLGLDVNYLGDAGSSLYTTGTPVVFQIVAPPGPANQVLIVVNDALGGANVSGERFRFLVEGFYDTNFNDTTPPVPEPATLALSGAGFVITAITFYRRKRKQ